MKIVRQEDCLIRNWNDLGLKIVWYENEMSLVWRSSWVYKVKGWNGLGKIVLEFRKWDDLVKIVLASEKKWDEFGSKTILKVRSSWKMKNFLSKYGKLRRSWRRSSWLTKGKKMRRSLVKIVLVSSEWDDLGGDRPGFR